MRIESFWEIHDDITEKNGEDDKEKRQKRKWLSFFNKKKKTKETKKKIYVKVKYQRAWKK